MSELPDLERGTVLVPKETPYGPEEARVAWADEQGQLLIVMGWRSGDRLLVNVPADGATVERDARGVLTEYEPAGSLSLLGQMNWKDIITRAATEMARVDQARFEGRETDYWRELAKVAFRIHYEETSKS